MTANPKMFSGIQLEVFALYRSLLRAAAKKTSFNSDFYNFVRHEFREKAHSVSRLEFRRIEHLIRYGKKQIKLIEMPGFSTAHMSLNQKTS